MFFVNVRSFRYHSEAQPAVYLNNLAGFFHTFSFVLLDASSLGLSLSSTSSSRLPKLSGYDSTNIYCAGSDMTMVMTKGLSFDSNCVQRDIEPVPLLYRQTSYTGPKNLPMCKYFVFVKFLSIGKVSNGK